MQGNCEGVNSIYKSWIPKIVSIAQQAGHEITDLYHQKAYQVKSKLDNSPVTEADLNAHRIIVTGLQALDPSLPILSEEGEQIPFEVRSQWSRYWLIDPLDGTEEFIRGTGEFTVNIALIENHRPVLGVVVAPVLQHDYWAARGAGAYFQNSASPAQAIQTAAIPHSPLKMAVSRKFHQQIDQHKLAWETLEKNLGEYELIYCGSALKICLVARGLVDLYPRMGITCEWDTAAGQCILEEAGGQILDLSREPLRYNLRASLENPGFYAISNHYLASRCCG